MKKKISICVEEEMVQKLENKLKEGMFRSRSHIVEYALNKLIGETK